MLSGTPEEMWNQCIKQWHMTAIDIMVPDMNSAFQLPYHHRDPFDRILIAQALEREATVVTFDSIFDSYGVKIAS